MPSIPGTVVISKLVPTDSADTYGTHEDKYGIGGIHTDVLDTAERDAIPAQRRKEGMLVYVKTPTPIMYQLVGGITNSNWVIFTGGANINDSSTSLTEVWSASKVNSLLSSRLSRFEVISIIAAFTNLNLITPPPSLNFILDVPLIGNNLTEFNRKALVFKRNGIELIKGTQVVYVNPSTVYFNFDLVVGEIIQVES